LPSFECKKPFFTAAFALGFGLDASTSEMSTRGGSAEEDEVEFSLLENPGVPGILMSKGWSLGGSLVAARSKDSGDSVVRPAGVGGVEKEAGVVSSGLLRSSTGPS